MTDDTVSKELKAGDKLVISEEFMEQLKTKSKLKHDKVSNRDLQNPEPLSFFVSSYITPNDIKSWGWASGTLTQATDLINRRYNDWRTTGSDTNEKIYANRDIEMVMGKLRDKDDFRAYRYKRYGENTNIPGTDLHFRTRRVYKGQGSGYEKLKDYNGYLGNVASISNYSSGEMPPTVNITHTETRSNSFTIEKSTTIDKSLGFDIDINVPYKMLGIPVTGSYNVNQTIKEVEVETTESKYSKSIYINPTLDSYRAKPGERCKFMTWTVMHNYFYKYTFSNILYGSTRIVWREKDRFFYLPKSRDLNVLSAEMLLHPNLRSKQMLDSNKAFNYSKLKSNIEVVYDRVQEVFYGAKCTNTSTNNVRYVGNYYDPQNNYIPNL
ncbi:hypothetical protein [Tenacibaculum sediminilitoris]|uniref:hypothetical protein n=1 Tax=Tenacibaculum sediminilitoris TaxID=1820334 RepID=UPI0038B53225